MTDEDLKLLNGLDRLAREGVLPVILPTEDDDDDPRSPTEWLADYLLAPLGVLFCACLFAVPIVGMLWCIYAMIVSIWNM